MIVENYVAYGNNNDAFGLNEQRVWDENMNVDIEYFDENSIDDFCSSFTTTANQLHTWLKENDVMKFSFTEINESNTDVNDVYGEYKEPWHLFDASESKDIGQILSEFLEFKFKR